MSIVARNFVVMLGASEEFFGVVSERGGSITGLRGDPKIRMALKRQSMIRSRGCMFTIRMYK